ncbi:hypothetical protein [Paraburkholderia sp. J76]|uniref:hypothetical protein n=1 Tax=Paraburkholderia sp. J76 TaxID=2805439 RepID=UPI002ABE3F08|nr:hypothetical protein [Paraburkholderia sp. J76]
MAAFAAATGFFLLPSATPAWSRFENDVTVYMVSCDAKKVNGVCTGREKADTPFTYKVSVDQRSVLFWRVDNPGLHHRLPFCAIHDTKTWLCQLNGEVVPRTKIGMAAGNYMEIATCTTDASMPVFYQVSLWHWWLVWLRTRFSPSNMPPMRGAG